MTDIKTIIQVMKDVSFLVDGPRNPIVVDNLLARIQESIESMQAAQSKPAEVQTGLPKEPPADLIESMCYRYAHDFGLDKDPDSPLSSGWTMQERQSLRSTMRQLYEEVSGNGFYKWK